MSMPSNGAIALYWCKRRIKDGPLPWGEVVDWYEPSCFACGYTHDDWEPSPLARGNADRVLISTWNKTNGRLQRCHVVPRMLDGSDDPWNLVLMCAECHQMSPDTADPQVLFRWMQQCPSSLFRVHWTAVEAMKDAADVCVSEYPGVQLADPEDGTFTSPDIRAAIDRLGIGTHGSKIAPGTYAAILQEAFRIAASRSAA